MLLDISLLMGCDIDWSTPAQSIAVGGLGGADGPPILSTAAQDADADASGDDNCGGSGGGRGRASTAEEPASAAAANSASGKEAAVAAAHRPPSAGITCGSNF